ncbi:glycosyltransferase family 9 protein [Candidatus Pacearchaeota archaeon]|nr:glycosyltransferase family 9 protein [Candidatus Pacearchaeota archaeon]
MKKICIIKLGALGDVIRTLPVIEGIREKYPDSEVTWITKKNSTDLLSNNLAIKRVFSLDNCNELLNEKFDFLYNFDTEEEATSLAMRIKADKKYGFCFEGGYPSSFNAASEYYLNTVFDDELKKNNLKTYQEMMFMAAELPYKKQHPPLFPTEEDMKYAENFIEKNKINRKNLIGIHIGADSRWPSKIWHEENLKEFIKKSSENEYEILVLGGPNESKKLDDLEKEMLENNVKIHRNNPENSHMQFASIIKLCKVVVCSDSFALHVSLAMKKPTIGLFFCTPPNEVEDYGLLKKIVSPKIYDFFPEKMDLYDEYLVKSISADEVLKEIIKIGR